MGGGRGERQAVTRTHTQPGARVSYPTHEAGLGPSKNHNTAKVIPFQNMPLWGCIFLAPFLLGYFCG